ncbi:fascin domain-containing protein [Nitrospira sp. BLG_2]|uniref:fascin domain-containing protein n=1 Tax=Nitrospira sp. BLG_2 TaxID=3397507 RepID=UPI003B9AFF02
MQVLGGGTLLSGSKVQFRTDNSRYFCAEGGGGGQLNATRTQPSEWETFEIIAPDTALGLPISDGQNIRLQCSNGYFVCAEDGGGREVNATRRIADSWETFVIEGVQGGVAPAFQPGTFMFTFDSMIISNTRSRHNDTDYASLSVAVNDGPPQTVKKFIGNLNNGTYTVGLSIGPIAIASPTDKVAFNYLVVNAGHQDNAKIDKILTDIGQGLSQAGTRAAISAAGALAGAVVGSTVGSFIMPAVGTAIGVAVGWLGGQLTGILTADCDGTVAIEQVGVTGQQLAGMLAAGAPYAHWTYHPGSDSSTGCGSNSMYFCHWSVQRLS